MPGRAEGRQERAVAPFASEGRERERRTSEEQRVPRACAAFLSLSLPRDQVGEPFPLLPSSLSAGSPIDARHSTCGGRTSRLGLVRRAARRTRDGRRTRAGCDSATARCRRRRRRRPPSPPSTKQQKSQNKTSRPPHLSKPLQITTASKPPVAHAGSLARNPLLPSPHPPPPRAPRRGRRLQPAAVGRRRPPAPQPAAAAAEEAEGARVTGTPTRTKSRGG